MSEWQMCTIGSVCNIVKGANVSLAIKNIAKIEIPAPPIEKQRSLIQLFNILYDFDRPFGDESANQSTILSKLRQREFIVSRGLIRLFVLSKKQDFQNAKDGLIPGITREYILNQRFPLPPLAEQRAIVERVEEMLAMVDEMEVQVKTRKVQAQGLLQALLREAFEGGGDNKTVIT
ncbi:MAG: hypothetical protein Ta2F_18330 [Termitinemataceae bacterium]|nr:MAG: hypothetical protein Ta2F_18330 [Termitinemataceae bacterium]